MKKLQTIVAAAVVLFLGQACIEPLSDREIKRKECDVQDRVKPGGTDGIIESESGIYLTSLVFPEDYDWRRDSAYGQINGKIQLWKDGEIIVSIDSGPESGRSMDQDRHRFLGGHLYSEAWNGHKTTYFRDSSIWFESGSMERVRGATNIGKDVYFLSEDCSKAELILRKNGKVTFADKAQRIMGDMENAGYGQSGSLYLDGKELCFTYLSGEDGKWYYFSGAEKHAIAVPDGVESIFDMKVNGGVVSLVAKMKDGRVPVLCTGGICYDLSYARGLSSSINDYNIFYENGSVYFSGSFTSGGYPRLRYGKWSQNGLVWSGQHDCQLFRHTEFISREEGYVSVIHWQGKDYSPKGLYNLSSPRCAAWGNNRMAVALTASDFGKKPALWLNGEMEDYDFNGFFTSATVIE